MIQTNANNITLLDGVKADITDTGKTITATMDTSTFVVTILLKNSSGTTLSTATLNLPLGTMVIGGSYDNVNKAVVLSNKDGTQSSFSIADLISGLQTEITSSNKLSSDLVDDTNNTNKFVTSTEKNTWNSKSDFSGDYNDLINKPTIPTVPTNVSAFTNDAGYLTSHQDITGKEDKTNKVTSLSSSSTDTQYPSAKCVYDIIGDVESILTTLTTGGGVS